MDSARDEIAQDEPRRIAKKTWATPALYVENTDVTQGATFSRTPPIETAFYHT